MQEMISYFRLEFFHYQLHKDTITTAFLQLNIRTFSWNPTKLAVH